VERQHPSAAASLREGLDETLTVLRLDLVPGLTRTMATTNPLENLNNQLRRITRNVKRWRDGTMVVRWIGAALQEAAKGFRRIRGYKGMEIPRFRGRPVKHENVRGVVHGKAEEKEVHG
jgi:transposase-like protein